MVGSVASDIEVRCCVGVECSVAVGLGVCDRVGLGVGDRIRLGVGIRLGIGDRIRLRVGVRLRIGDRIRLRVLAVVGLDIAAQVGDVTARVGDVRSRVGRSPFAFLTASCKGKEQANSYPSSSIHRDLARAGPGSAWGSTADRNVSPIPPVPRAR
jgi:hypothetical protein